MRKSDHHLLDTRQTVGNWRAFAYFGNQRGRTWNASTDEHVTWSSLTKRTWWLRIWSLPHESQAPNELKNLRKGQTITLESEGAVLLNKSKQFKQIRWLQWGQTESVWFDLLRSPRNRQRVIIRSAREKLFFTFSWPLTALIVLKAFAAVLQWSLKSWLVFLRLYRRLHVLKNERQNENEEKIAGLWKKGTKLKQDAFPNRQRRNMKKPLSLYKS